MDTEETQAACQCVATGASEPERQAAGFCHTSTHMPRLQLRNRRNATQVHLLWCLLRRTIGAVLSPAVLVHDFLAVCSWSQQRRFQLLGQVLPLRAGPLSEACAAVAQEEPFNMMSGQVFPGVMGLSDSLLSCTAQETCHGCRVGPGGVGPGHTLPAAILACGVCRVSCTGSLENLENT